MEANDPELIRLLTIEVTSVGANVRRIAKKRGLSIRKLIGRADLNHQTVFDVLHGRANPTVKTLLQLAVVLEVDVRDFFDAHREG